MDVEFPDKLQFLFDPYRYKVAHGGRGSGKSWGFARALLILGAQSTLRILCTREIQKSIKDSVKRLLDDQIEAMGLSEFYLSLETEIRGRNGTEFLFAGLANHTVESIKSYEGIDIVWIEEAQTVSKKSLDILVPTIRRPKSEIWVTFNPVLDSDEVWTRFVVNPPPRSHVEQVNWVDNPWFPDVLELEREQCKIANPDDYDNIWEGKCRSAVIGAIYANEVAQAQMDGRICPVPYNARSKVHAVWDLGWNDSMSIILVQKVGPTTIAVIDYIEDSFKTLDHYAGLLKAMPYNWGYDYLPHDGNTKDYKTGMSAAEILKRFGRKTKQTPNIPIEQGIKMARMVFGRCWLDKNKTTRLQECLKRYRRAVSSSTGEPGAPVHDEYSHGCLDGATQVLTKRGPIQIKDVVVDDFVWTPAGFARVLNSGPTKVATEIIEITMSNGSILMATPEHKIFTTRGIVLADALRYTDAIFTKECNPCVSYQGIKSAGYRDAVIASFKASAIGSGRPGESMVHKLVARLDCFTLRFTRRCMVILGYVQSRTRLTAIFPTPALITGLSLDQSESESTQYKNSIPCCSTGSQKATTRPSIKSTAESPCTAMFGSSTMGQFKMDSTSTTRMATNPITPLKTLKCFLRQITQAITHKAAIGLEVMKTKLKYLLLVNWLKNGTQVKPEKNGTQATQSKAGETENGTQSNAKNAARSSLLHTQQEQSSAIRIAGLKRLEGAEAKRLVYDLTVEKHHCYLANGLLVSNSDAFRYLGVVAESLSNEDDYEPPRIPAFRPAVPGTGI